MIDASNEGHIVGSCNPDRNLSLTGLTMRIGDQHRDGQVMCFSGLEMLVGRMAGIKAVAAVGIQGKPVNRCRQAEGQMVTVIDIRCRDLAVNNRVLGYHLHRLAGNHRSVVCAVDSNDKEIAGAATVIVGDFNGNPERGVVARSEVIVGRIRRIEGIAAVRVDAEPGHRRSRRVGQHIARVGIGCG